MLAGWVERRGVQIIDTAEKADVIVVNTCAFISEAKEEAIEAILAAARLKQEGHCRALYVCGCFPQRYTSELSRELPEVDGFYGVQEWTKLLEIIAPEGADPDDNPYLGRRRETPAHYAYLRIADGCDHGCTYCVIPSIRGVYKSRPPDEIMAEVEHLARSSVKELLPVAQELNSYGHDLGLGQKNRPLMDLLERIGGVEGIEWIRPLYLHPPACDIELFDFWASQEKLCHYLDFPIEHAADRIIKTMGRGSSQKQLKNLIEYARKVMPDVVIRTSIIVGFPGETDDDFNQLLDFVKNTRFERLGCFRYSAEEGSFAFNLPTQLPEKLKKRRQTRLMTLQRKIAQEINRKRIGEIEEVFVDEYEKASGYSIAHSRKELPELDGDILIKGEYPAGAKLTVRIESDLEYDLVAVPV